MVRLAKQFLVVVEFQVANSGASPDRRRLSLEDFPHQRVDRPSTE